MNIARDHANSLQSMYSGVKGTFSLVVTEPSTDGRVVTFLETDNKNIRIYLTSKNPVELESGDIVSGRMTFYTPKNDTGEDFSFSRYLASRGIHLQASADNVQITGKYQKGIMATFYSLRSKASDLGRKYFRGDHRALFNAMVLGDKSLLSDTLYSVLQGSGLNHIAVVSGMHLSVVIAFIILLSQKFFGKGRIGYLIAISGAVFLTFITGSGASVVRAFIMCLVYYLSRLLYRENDSLTSLFCAFWIMIIVNPYIIFHTGFVLSVLSVLGIILYSRHFYSFFRRLMPRKVSEAISLTLAVQLVLTPAIVCFFGVVTPYAPISNMFAVPLAAIYVVIGMIFLILSPLTPVAKVLSQVMTFLADGIINLCESISSLPYALVEYRGNVFAFSVMWAFLAVLVFARNNSGKRKLK